MASPSRRQAALGISISLGVTAVLVAAQLAVNAKHVDMGMLTRDLAATANVKWYAGFFSSLGLDDMAQLHEDVIPGHLGLPEEYVYVAEALMFLAFLVLNRAVLLRHAPVILVMALAGFGASVAADILDRILILPIVVEDGAKLIGICNWVAVGATLLAAGVRPSDEA